MRQSEVERSILVDLLVSGDNRAGNIGRETGHPSNSVSRSLNSLLEEGLVRNKGDGVYELTDRGRDEARAIIKREVSLYPE